MVMDPANRGHAVRIGDFIGKNWGKVSHIGREEITVTETIADQQMTIEQLKSYIMR